MSAELLRRAAALMRERAEDAAAPHHPYGDTEMDLVETTAHWSLEISEYVGGDMGEHAASWHPAVALAVADWLDATALELKALGDPPLKIQEGRRSSALAVARAYLGEQQ